MVVLKLRQKGGVWSAGCENENFLLEQKKRIGVLAAQNIFFCNFYLF